MTQEMRQVITDTMDCSRQNIQLLTEAEQLFYQTMPVSASEGASYDVALDFLRQSRRNSDTLLQQCQAYLAEADSAESESQLVDQDREEVPQGHS